ncbi:hypothetical protein GQ600_376 [Phytophthora cactorum]|nr:hypothetical protein GQ600_376 [Phytophthora cactorum]
MTKEYTLDEIRRLADTNPEKLAQEYQASRAATANLVDRARVGYGNRFIYNGSIKPLAHMMLIVGGAGCAVEWWCHHSTLLIKYESNEDRL